MGLPFVFIVPITVSSFYFAYVFILSISKMPLHERSTFTVP